jgi:PPOX class probable F420-dependent enzyme
VASLANRFYHWVRDPSAHSVGAAQQTASGFDGLRGHKYCLLVTSKRNGEAVPTPVWFGLSEGKLYVRSAANVGKIKRIGNDPRVRVAPCTARGKPRGLPAGGVARVLEDRRDVELAESALRASYGLGRKLYQRVGTSVDRETVYVEVEPT